MEDAEYPSSKRRRIKEDLEIQGQLHDENGQGDRIDGLNGHGMVPYERGTIHEEHEAAAAYDNSESPWFTQWRPEILRYDVSIDVTIDWDDVGVLYDSPRRGHDELFGTLSGGLGDRVTSISISTKPNQQGIFSEEEWGKEELTIRLALNGSTSNRTIDRGPFQGSSAVEGFRQLWHWKAELRRFKDNAIARECVVWSSHSPVPIQIVKHLLDVHFRANDNSVKVRSVDLGQTLPNTNTKLVAAVGFETVWKSFQTLSNTLLNLSALPIRIHTVKPIGAELSSSSLRVLSSQPVELFIEFESSSNWPESLPAIHTPKSPSSSKSQIR